jgi:hypothetical protein
VSFLQELGGIPPGSRLFAKRWEVSIRLKGSFSKGLVRPKAIAGRTMSCFRAGDALQFEVEPPSGPDSVAFFGPSFVPLSSPGLGFYMIPGQGTGLSPAPPPPPSRGWTSPETGRVSSATGKDILRALVVVSQSPGTNYPGF